MITLIALPPFVFDPHRARRHEQDNLKIFLIETITKVGIKALHILRLTLQYSLESVVETLRLAPTGYMVFVVKPIAEADFLQSQARAALFIVANVVALLAAAVFALFTFVKKIYLNYQHSKTAVTVESFCKKLHLDIQHFRSDRLALDTKNVPQDVSLERLPDLFREINFDNPEQPGYFPPQALQDEKKFFTPAQLLDGLKQFIKHVEKRTPFIGTPPAEDKRNLCLFYQKIEDAVRITLFKVLTDLKNAKKHGVDSRPYQYALENIGRVVITLSIAGMRCGARYMGEAMDLYETFCGSVEKSVGSLHNHLIERLADERKSIVVGLIEPSGENNTHRYTLSLNRLGRLLGLPHTENIQEFIYTEFNFDRELEAFFRIYNRERIIHTVQQEFKTSQDFREKFIDWAKSQMGEWNREKYRADPKTLEKLRQALVDPSVELISEEKELLHLFMECYTLFLNSRTKKPLAITSWRNVLEDCFTNAHVKAFLAKKFPGMLERRTTVNKLITRLDEHAIGSECVALLKVYSDKDQADIHAHILSTWEKLNRVGNAQRILPLPTSALLSVINLKADLKEVYEAHLQREREGKFIKALHVDQLSTDGINAGMMEWLLISHGIFTPRS